MKLLLLKLLIKIHLVNMKNFLNRILNFFMSFWGIMSIGCGLIVLGTIFLLINNTITDTIGIGCYLLDGLFVVALIVIGIINMFKRKL